MSIRHLLLLALTLGSVSLAQPQEPAAVTATQSAHPFFLSQEPPRWSLLTPEQALADAREGMQLARARIQSILAIAPQDATFENTILEFEEALDELQCVIRLMLHLTYVDDSEANRAAMEEIVRLMSECSSEFFCNEQLWLLMKHAATPEKIAQLSPVKQRAIKQCIDIFIDNGANLSTEEKMQKMELEKEILLLGMQYEKNLQDFIQTWELHITDAAELDGVPPAMMSNLANAAREAGKDGWLISMRDSSVTAVMALCRVEETRKRCWHAVAGCGAGTPYDNSPVIAGLLEKRQALAELLGFKNYADFAARTRMVQSGDAALGFVDMMIAKLKPAFDAECQDLLKVYSAYVGYPVTALKPWDELQAISAYLSYKSTVAPSLIRAYLPCDTVVNGMFAVYGDLLGVTIKELPSVHIKPGEVCPDGMIEVWHPDVKCYALYDTATGTQIGTFYLDLYRRANKRGGACCVPLRIADSGPGGKVLEPHIAALLANFAPPAEGSPNLLSHENVIVLFHEFGHLLHHLLSHTEIKGHCAMGVAWDFSEFPSTLSEYWAWSPEVLSTFARHYKNGSPCPQSLLSQLAASRSELQVILYMEVLRKAKLDMELHIHYKEKFQGRPLDDVSHALAQSCQIPYAAVPYSPLRNLPHCFSGAYSAGVYTYIWSEVMAADVYTYFAEHGMLNSELGKKYREIILEKGDSIPADELYRLLMGRDPNPDAFMKVHNINR